MGFIYITIQPEPSELCVRPSRNHVLPGPSCAIEQTTKDVEGDNKGCANNLLGRESRSTEAHYVFQWKSISTQLVDYSRTFYCEANVRLAG